MYFFSSLVGMGRLADASMGSTSFFLHVFLSRTRLAEEASTGDLSVFFFCGGVFLGMLVKN